MTCTGCGKISLAAIDSKLRSLLKMELMADGLPSFTDICRIVWHIGNITYEVDLLEKRRDR
jgi:hypothetical protein